jgi:hypothetical protein
MKPHQSNQARHFSLIAGSGVAAWGFMAALVMALGTSSITAQSAANFDTQTLAPEAPAPPVEKTAKPVVTEVPAAISTPSRQIGPTEMETYLASVASVFLSRGRTLDPFGMPQDPDAKPIVKAPVPGAVKRIAPIQATPFPEIIDKIVVTTIMPGEKRFLVGTRSIKQGEQIPLTFRGKQIRVQVTEVTSRQISFKNLDNGEMASRKLDMLPVGMTPGSRGITAPGMTLDRPNAPIELDAVEGAP